MRVGARGIATTARALNPVYVAGQGFVNVTRKKDHGLAAMGGQAIKAAMADAGVDASVPQALYVGNMLSGMLSSQQHMGPLLANAAGLGPVETATVEACCGSGGAALRWGYMAVASGMYETVVVAGAEQMTHCDTEKTTLGLATASHWETEGSQGATFVSINGVLMDLYMKKYGVKHEDFAPFALTAHANGLTAQHATLKKALDQATYDAARMITPPITLFDASPMCDGAAAVVLTSRPDLARHGGRPAVRIAGSAAASDILPLAERPDPLRLLAVEKSAADALAQSKLTRAELGIFELHDAYSIMACLSLENAGFAPRGQGTAFAKSGAIGLDGSVPMCTFGGLKARGHPVGATGVYQAAEMALQLTNRAGQNQVKGARTAMIQNIGGAGASVFAHVFIAE
jgi:acetyl-CoA C-acetyltransferase